MKSAIRKPKATTFDPALAAAIGFRVTARREELGFNQRELAQFSGMTHGTIAIIERGKSMPGVSTILGLCRALGMTPNELLGWSEPE